MKRRIIIDALFCSGLAAGMVSPASAEDSASAPVASEASNSELPSMHDIAEQIPKGFIVGGLAIYAEPRYDLDGSNTSAFPGFIYLGDRYYYLGDRVRYTVVRGEKVSFTVNGRVRFGNLDPNDNPAYADLNERKTEFEAGVGVSAITPIGLLSAQWLTDVSGHSKGQLANVTLFMPYYKNNFLLMPSIGANWRSGGMSNYYFGGVSAPEASFAIPAYDTGSTLSYNLMLTTGYRLSERWAIGASVYYEHLDASIADSPIVQSGEEFTYFFGTAYYWK